MKPDDGKKVIQERSEHVLLLVDVINDFDFPDAPKLLRFALPAARRIAVLKRRLRAAGIPAIYVNDNFGRWRSDFKQQVEQCIAEGARGAEIARILIPAEDDYFVLKPKHSGFYSTCLEVVLASLGAKHLIITGFAADICVLFTANDAHMREYTISVPIDCVASETAVACRTACLQMKRFLGAKTTSSRALRVERSRH